MKASLPALAILCGLLPVSFSAPAQDWSDTMLPGVFWQGVASSADGMKLVADGYESGIWVSTNRGASWAETSTIVSNRWSAVASSADGVKLVAVSQDEFGSIYTSTNSGLTWQPTIAPYDDYKSVASSADGRTLVAASLYYDIYVSTNSGSTWVEQTYFPVNMSWNGIFNSVTISADGTKMAAAAGALYIQGGTTDVLYGGGQIQFSTNSGASWNTSDAPNNWSWAAITCSSNGNFMVAAAYGDTNHNPGPIYISTNSGANWLPTIAPKLAYGAVACSADGTKITAACVGSTQTISPNGVYTSTNSGATWTEDQTLTDANAMACSADGTKRVAATGLELPNFVAVSPPLAVTAGPQLTIIPSGNTVALYWPTSASGYTLQSTTNFSTGSWSSISNGIGTIGSYYAFTNATSGQAAFFRLKQ
jgi:hypothetical protein